MGEKGEAWSAQELARRPIHADGRNKNVRALQRTFVLGWNAWAVWWWRRGRGRGSVGQRGGVCIGENGDA